MKKIHSLLALLLLLVASANAQTVNIVCSQPQATYYSSTKDLYVLMFDVNQHYAFAFDILCATGATDIVDGQTYTLSDMVESESYGINYLSQSFIYFASVNFVRNAGAYTVDIIDEDSVHYHLTYATTTPITQFVDSVSITMDNGRKNQLVDATSQSAFKLVGYDMTKTYNMNLVVLSNQIAGTYTIDDIFSDYTSLYVNGDQVALNTIRGSFTVAGNADTCSTYVELVGTDSILYKITFEYPGTIVPITPIDTVDVLMNNGEENDVVDYCAYGAFQLIGYDLNKDYVLNLIVESDQIAGTYTQDDIDDYNSSFTVNGNQIDMYEISNFTVVGNADTCSTYIEILGEDSVLYRITFEYPGYIPPITPKDTVVISMNDVTVYDYISAIGAFQIAGQNTDYFMSLTLNSDQIAGTYTENDFYEGYEYTYLYSTIGGDTTEIDALSYNNITVTGTAKTTVNAHVEMLSTDTILYIIDMNYVYVPIVPVDTIDIVLDDPAKNNFMKDNGYFYLSGDNGSYAYQAIIFSNTISGSYTEDDIYANYTGLFSIVGTDTTYVPYIEYRSIVVIGDTSFFNAHFEMIGRDSILYRITLVYPGAVAPTDTVTISFTNPVGNFVFDQTATNGSFTIVGGSDLNNEYGLALMVNSTTFAGTYTQASVAALDLVHVVGTDTTEILYSEIHDFTITGNANNCSTYIEMVGSDGIFYKMTFTYSGIPTKVENTEVTFVAYSEENTIVINGAEGETMAVYDMAGKMIANTKAASNVERVNVGVAGIYVVRIGEKAMKVVVK